MRFRGPKALKDTQDSPQAAMMCSTTSTYRLGVLLPYTGESELVIMIAVVTEEMHGSD